ncbi:hypothetical protein KSF_096070 [Reticulibacter mediterranei]|uniref:Uncharacterized protein n=1 Tax=Reticulibacter mediterranei TaxID=2778369 RepID=A0A8J3IX85_9CHLR|nr:hypothetical protein KSF_096070 [Reticulibacter mediterranei]
MFPRHIVFLAADLESTPRNVVFLAADLESGARQEVSLFVVVPITGMNVTTHPAQNCALEIVYWHAAAPVLLAT